MKSQLYRSLDRKYISEIEFNKLFELCNKIASGISKLIEYLNKSDVKGSKFKDRI